MKGLSGTRRVVELTPNEYAMMKKYRVTYRVCMVTSALDNKPKLSIFVFSPDRNTWVDEDGWVLGIAEVVSARLQG